MHYKLKFRLLLATDLNAIPTVHPHGHDKEFARGVFLEKAAVIRIITVM